MVLHGCESSNDRQREQGEDCPDAYQVMAGVQRHANVQLRIDEGTKR